MTLGNSGIIERPPKGSDIYSFCQNLDIFLQNSLRFEPTPADPSLVFSLVL